MKKFNTTIDSAWYHQKTEEKHNGLSFIDLLIYQKIIKDDPFFPPSRLFLESHPQSYHSKFL